VSHAPFRLSIAEALVLGTLVSAASCEQWFLAVNSDGLLFVSVVVVDDGRRDPFSLRIRDANGLVRMREVPPSGRVTLSALADGPLELTLVTPEGCQVDGANPRTVTVASGEPVRANFKVACG
jgi:hypothetical protein